MFYLNVPQKPRKRMEIYLGRLTYMVKEILAETFTVRNTKTNGSIYSIIEGEILRGPYC